MIRQSVNVPNAAVSVWITTASSRCDSPSNSFPASASRKSKLASEPPPVTKRVVEKGSFCGTGLLRLADHLVLSISAVVANGFKLQFHFAWEAMWNDMLKHRVNRLVARCQQNFHDRVVPRGCHSRMNGLVCVRWDTVILTVADPQEPCSATFSHYHMRNAVAMINYADPRCCMRKRCSNTFCIRRFSNTFCIRHRGGKYLELGGVAAIVT